jgi:1-acyl-sn-glycerol-3-phosphate acyltransferase
MILSVKAVLKILAIALWTIPLVSLQAILLPFYKGQFAYVIPKFWHKGICFILGLKVEIIGEPVQNKQIIYISNHLSYLDIPVIGAFLKASFIAKEDIASWPVIGYLASVQQTAFISRSSRQAKKVANALDSMVQEGKSLILFPEGTSSAGTTVLPFKSSLFSLAQPKNMSPLSIQPFILELIEVDKNAVTEISRDLYSWYGDMDFGPHIWDFLKTKGAKIRLNFLPPIYPTDNQDRKDLCMLVENQISSGLKSL